MGMQSQKQQTSSGKLWGHNVIFDREGSQEKPYMSRWWIGRLRVHVFHRGDADPDCHDHPWDFWTFPLTSYVEEVVTEELVWGTDQPLKERKRTRQVVPAFRLSFRPATHTHRVLGRYAGNAWDTAWKQIRERVTPGYVNAHTDLEPYTDTGKPIITIVWRSREYRKWGFLKDRDGRWCWVAWKDYVFGGGKDAPCE